MILCFIQFNLFNFLRGHKVNFKRGGSYIDSVDWIKKQQATKNPKIQMTNVFNTLQLLH